MKIGFSFGRCVRDIVNGVVGYDEVLVIVTSTRILEVEGIRGMLEEYAWSPEYLAGLDLDECEAVATRLYKEGKIHQPRMFGQYRSKVNGRYVWMDLVPTDLADNPTVKEAWDQYRMLLQLITEEGIPDAEEGARSVKFGE